MVRREEAVLSLCRWQLCLTLAKHSRYALQQRLRKASSDDSVVAGTSTTDLWLSGSAAMMRVGPRTAAVLSAKPKCEAVHALRLICRGEQSLQLHDRSPVTTCTCFRRPSCYAMVVFESCASLRIRAAECWWLQRTASCLRCICFAFARADKHVRQLCPNEKAMGVQGLWPLLEPVGRRVNIEALTNKRLAVGKIHRCCCGVLPVATSPGT